MRKMKEFYKLYKDAMASRNDGEYDVNEVQLKKLENAYAFFMEHGENVELKVIPREINGGITAYVTVFYLNGDDLTTLSGIIGNMGALSIDATTDGQVCISFTIPGVFYKKN